MTTRYAMPLLLAVTLTLATAGCSKEPAKTQAPAVGAPAAAATVEKIPILPGYKYYIGGPSLKRDPYGRYRINKFNGEVEQPPSRGMIFGAKQDGNQLEYRVWANGKLLAFHKGIMRDGLFWQEYVENIRDGKVVAREWAVNDDSIKRSKVTTQDIDPDNGEVIRTKEASISYLPPAMPADLESDADSETHTFGPGGEIPTPKPEAAPAGTDQAPGATPPAATPPAAEPKAGGQ